jgi:Zn-dependent peptidase ImmA (M78 family)
MIFRRDGIEYREGDDIEPSNAFKKRVEEYAEQVAEALDFNVGENPAKLVEQLGGRVHYEDLEELIDEDGSIFVHGQSDFDILLPEYTSPRRDRFTIAHELGHYFLHSLQGEIPIIAYRQGSTRIEWEANWFAASLLMPAGKFLKAWSSSQNLARVAEQFGVSEDAAEVRKKALCGN